MTAQTGMALLLTLVSACAINWGYLTEHRAASALPPLSPRRPLRSIRALLGSRLWLIGFASESAGFALYVVAVALAPLALVQAVAAGGIGVLALLVSRTSRTRLDRRERLGVTIAIGGLALLGISLAGGSEGARPARGWGSRSGSGHRWWSRAPSRHPCSRARGVVRRPWGSRRACCSLAATLPRR